MKYDNLLKAIFYDAMPLFLRALHCAPVVEYLNIEFQARPKLLADVVARLADGKILHLEFQLSNDPRMHWRCYHYRGAIQELWEDAEVIQIVVYLGNGPVRMIHEIKKRRLDYSYEIVDMKELPADASLIPPVILSACWRCCVIRRIRERSSGRFSAHGGICRTRNCSRTLTG